MGTGGGGMALLFSGQGRKSSQRKQHKMAGFEEREHILKDVKTIWGNLKADTTPIFQLPALPPKPLVVTDTGKHVSNRSPNFLHSQRVFAQHKLETTLESQHLENSQVLNLGV